MSDRIWALQGQAIHHVLERAAGPNDVVEWRLYDDVDGQMLGGQIDLLTVTGEGEVLVDFKWTSAWTWVFTDAGYRDEWAKQLNILAYLAERNGASVDSLEIVALYRDWQRSKATDETYPSQPVKRIPIPLWSFPEREAYVRERIALHVHADETGVVPKCTPEDQWAKPDTFAVKKPKRKKALRVFESEAQAERYVEDTTGDDLFIEYRPGEPVRCENFCPVRELCQQRALEKAEAPLPDQIDYSE
ncbi:MAG: PD-(D/E)XK nuclease family protein [Salinibacter sp.]